MKHGFLPVTPEEVRARGWDAPDFVFVTGDAYVDHPSFGCAILTRVLESAGYRVCILRQPDWHTAEDFARFGRPRLGVSCQRGRNRQHGQPLHRGQTAARQRRILSRRRAGTPPRPGDDRLLQPHPRSVSRRADRHRRRGGFAAALRALRLLGQLACAGPLLFDCGADILLFGMGEQLHRWKRPNCWKKPDWRDYLTRAAAARCFLAKEPPAGSMKPSASFEEVAADKRAYAEAFHAAVSRAGRRARQAARAGMRTTRWLLSEYSARCR